MTGGLIGAAQGYWVAYWRKPSFIVTLAGMLVFRGLSLWLLEGQSVAPFPREFQVIANGFIPDVFPTGLGEGLAAIFAANRFNVLALLAGVAAACIVLWMGQRQRLRNKAYGIEDEPFSFFMARNLIIAAALIFITYKLATFRGLPNVLVTMSVLTIIYAFMTSSTVIGRRIYALGGNEKAAKLSGIKTERLTFLAFVNMGVLAAVAGMVFEDIDDYKARIDDDALDVDENCVLVLKNCGPKGYPGMAEVGNMGLPPKILKKGITDMVRISDARMSGTAYGTVVLHTSPEAATGGPLAAVENGDMIEIDVPARRLHVDITDEELAARMARWSAPADQPSSGYAWLHQTHVNGADTGADLDFLAGCRGSPVGRDSH